jgi:GABA permease
VVANQTLGGDQLLEQLRERMEAGPCHFHVLVPATPVDQLEPHPGYQDPTKGGPKASAEELGWVAARQRLHQELLRLRRLGAEVDGEVGEADPDAAIKEVPGSQPVDEIILSTLPQRRSRWFARDLPRRVQHDFGLSVTHVVAEPGAPV